MQIYLVTYLLIGTEASMPQSMLPDAAHGSDAARWQITVAVCCRRVSVRRDHVHAATQHRLLRDPGVLIGHVVQVCWSRDTGVRAEHSDGDYVVAVVLDQHRERPGGALIAPWASCSHTHMPLSSSTESVPARINLGLLTVVTITYQSTGVNATLPRVLQTT